MEFDTDRWYEHLESSSRLLTQPARIAFAASMVERLYPNFAAFASMCGIDGVPILRSCLDDIWRASIRLDQWDSRGWEARTHLLESIGPFSDDFTSVLTACAQNAVSGALSAGALCADPDDVSQIVAISKAAAESLYLYLAHVTTPLTGSLWDKSWNEWIEKSALFPEEMVREVTDLQSLQGVTEVTEDVISALRSGTVGIQPFARGLACRKHSAPPGGR